MSVFSVGTKIVINEKKISMKRIALTFLFASCAFLMGQAQSKTSKQENASKAKYAKIEKERQQKFEEQRLERLEYDSLRYAKDSVYQAKFDSSRISWKDSVAYAQDSMNLDKYKTMNTQSEEWNNMEKQRAMIYKEAKLNDYQITQARFVSQQYAEKAAALNDDSMKSAEEKTMAMAQLNAEREMKLKTVLGKSRAKKLEKARKSYVKKNGAIVADSWIETASAYKIPAKNKK